MRTEVMFHLRSGESVLVEFEGEYGMKELAELLADHNGQWLVFPPNSYHADTVLIKQMSVTHITHQQFRE